MRCSGCSPLGGKELWNMTISRHQPFVIDIVWDCLASHRIVGPCDRWEFPSIYKGHWQSPCTALPPGPVLGLRQRDCERVYRASAPSDIPPVLINWNPRHEVILTHWGRDKMAAIFQTTFSNAFYWMKLYEFRLKFHWSLFLRVQLTISQHWFR